MLKTDPDDVLITSELIGAELFCEREDLERVAEITSSEMLNTESEYVLNLQIPLNKRTKWLQQQIEKKLKAARKQFDKRKKNASESNALYSLCTKRASASELKRYLLVYDYVQANKNAKSAEIAEALNRQTMKETSNEKSFENSKTYESQRQMIYRMKKTAKQIVANTAKGKFPLHSAR